MFIKFDDYIFSKTYPDYFVKMEFQVCDGNSDDENMVYSIDMIKDQTEHFSWTYQTEKERDDKFDELMGLLCG